MTQGTRSRPPQGGEIIEAGRRGAHRARPSAVLAVLPALAVLAVLAALGVLVYSLWLKPMTTTTTTGDLTGSSGAATGSATGSAKVSPSASSSASVSSSAAASAGGSTSGPALAAVDPNVAVNFFNATATKGLSRKAAALAQTAGWHIGMIQTWTGAAVTQTTIYVGTSQLQSAGQALAATLKVGVVKVSSSRAGKGITVLVASDFTGA